MIAWPFALAYGVLFARKRALALGYAREHARAHDDAAPPAATILQPILGGDPLLEETLEHNVREIANASFVWLIDAGDAAAGTACEAIRARHPARDIRIVVCAPAGERDNPKLDKLARGEACVRTNAVVVLDDDTMVSRAGYAALLAALATHDLATGLPSYEAGNDLPSALVEQFVDDNAALTYLASCALAPPLTINGMCYALTTDTLARMGGFAAYLRWLPDDLAIARGVVDRGGTIRQTPCPQRIRTSVRDPAHYVALMHRWFLFALLLLERVSPRERARIAVDHVVPPLLLWAVVLVTLTSPSRGNLATVAVLLAARSAAHEDLQRRIYGRSRHRPLVSIVSELVEPLHALHALARKSIRWRSRRIVVRAADDFTVVR
jgi:ceramide glucosyltransferase